MKLWTLILASALAFTSLHADASKRLGGGKSVGQQSNNVTQNQAAKPAAPAQATPAAPAPAPLRRRLLFIMMTRARTGVRSLPGTLPAASDGDRGVAICSLKYAAAWRT